MNNNNSSTQIPSLSAHPNTLAHCYINSTLCSTQIPSLSAHPNTLAHCYTNNPICCTQIPSLSAHPNTLAHCYINNTLCSSQIPLLHSPTTCDFVRRQFITNWYYSFLSSSAIYDGTQVTSEFTTMTLNDDLERTRKEMAIEYFKVCEDIWWVWDWGRAHADSLPVSSKPLLRYYSTHITAKRFLGSYFSYLLSLKFIICSDSASNRNEYQEYFVRVKAAGA
jgi:hypothetical protein